MRDPDIAAREQAEVSRCLTMLEQAIKDNGFLVTKERAQNNFPILNGGGTLPNTGPELQGR